MSFLRDDLTDLARCLRFYARLPVPRLPGEADPHAAPDFARLPRMVPLVGVVIGLIPAGVLLGALALRLGPLVAAGLSVAALVLVSGALHEDGLADTADGFWGGRTRERRLEIMRDSRVGSYGALAIALSLGLRVLLLGTLADRLPPLAVATLVILVAALSRTAGLLPLALLRPARADGASATVGQPTRGTLAVACLLMALVAAALTALGRLTPVGVGLAALAAIGAALIVTRLSARAIGGQTGDVAGAAQQAAEVAALLAMLAVTPP
jgi:adenosylcobinamide-GDP ribazoletransferase